MDSRGESELNNRIEFVKKQIADIKQANRSFITQDFRRQLDLVGNNITDVFVYAKENGLVRYLINDFINDLNSWLVYLKDLSSATAFLPHLEECACCGSDHFNRFKNKNREDIENSILSDIQQRFPHPSAQVINYLSFGGGDLLQDYIIILKMMLLGYKLNINLVDPTHFRYQIIDENTTITRERYSKILLDEDILDESQISIRKSKALQQFESLLLIAPALDSHIEINTFLSMDDFISEQNQDLVVAIDIDNFYEKPFNDSIKAKMCLQENGRWFFSNHTGNYIFSKDICLQSPHFNTGNNKKFEQVLGNLPQRNGESLNISVINSQNLVTIIHAIIIPYIKKHSDLNEVTLTMPSPPDMSEEYFCHFINLFVPNVKLTLNYVNSINNIENHLAQFDDNQDLVIAYVNVKNNVNGLQENLNNMNSKFANADFYCYAEVFKDIGNNRLILMYSTEWVWNSVEQQILSNHMSESDILYFQNIYMQKKNLLKENEENVTSGKEKYRPHDKNYQPHSLPLQASISHHALFKRDAEKKNSNLEKRKILKEIKLKILFYENKIKSENESFIWIDQGKINLWQDKIAVLKQANRLLIGISSPYELNQTENQHSKWNEGSETKALVNKVKGILNIPLDWHEYDKQVQRHGK